MLNDIIDDFAEPYTVNSYAAGAYVNGEWVRGAAVPRTIQAAVVPLSGQQLQRVPEGFSTRENRVVYTKASLVPDQDVAGANGGDYLVYAGKEWQCYQSSEWIQEGGFFVAFVARVS